MLQPRDPGFDPVIMDWWLEINARLAMPMDLFSGSSRPLQDWASQPEADAVWYYALDLFEEDEFHKFLTLAQHMQSIDSVHVVTALYITSQLSDDLLHDIQIPGVWLVRVQKT